MTEKSTIYALINLSDTERGFTDESIEVGFRVRSRRKMLELAELAFYGALELHLYSDFDFKGDESMVDLLTRYGDRYIPHEMPLRGVEPIVDIVTENALGRHVCWYRYVLCDVASANLFSTMKGAHAEASSEAGTSVGSDTKAEIRKTLERVALCHRGARGTRTQLESVGALSLDSLLDMYDATD